MKRDIQQATIDSLLQIQRWVKEGDAQAAHLGLSEVIDDLSGSMVSITYERPDDDGPRPGDAETAEELYFNNID